MIRYNDRKRREWDGAQTDAVFRDGVRAGEHEPGGAAAVCLPAGALQIHGEALGGAGRAAVRANRARRAAHGVRAAILPRIRRILREEQEIVRDIHLCRDQSFSCWGYLTGSCNAHSVLPVRVLHDIGERYPAVTIQIREHEDEELVWLIVQGELHAGYGVDLPQTSQLELTRIATEPLCALVNRNHPLAGCREVTMKALAGECILSCRNVSRDERLQKKIQGQVSSLRGEARFCD